MSEGFGLFRCFGAWVGDCIRLKFGGLEMGDSGLVHSPDTLNTKPSAALNPDVRLHPSVGGSPFDGSESYCLGVPRLFLDFGFRVELRGLGLTWACCLGYQVWLLGFLFGRRIFGLRLFH